MSEDDSTCSGNLNSTNCLLKALLGATRQQDGKAADADFNWDPLSFGFTAPVGILAALFTFLTVVQMLLASGPGRRRSDKQVIGRWSSKKKTRLSWTEMRLLTIVPTPVLRLHMLRLYLESGFGLLDPSSDVGDNDSGQTRHRWVRLWTRILSDLSFLTRNYAKILQNTMGKLASFVLRLKGPKPGDQSLPTDNTTQSSRAKWLVHLEELGLEDFIFEWCDIEQNAADYLPSDLQAVPAYSEVGCAVALAAASGISSLKTEEQSPYPLIIGDSFQLNFREHPLLGSIGVFSRYGRRVQTPCPSTKIDLLLALRHAQGEVLLRNKRYNVSARHLYAGDYYFRPYCRCRATRPDRICSSISLVYEKHKNLLWLIIAGTPDRVPAIFPSRSVKLRNVLTIYILQAQSWAHMRGARVHDDIRMIFLSEFGPVKVWWTDESIKEPGGGMLSSFLASEPRSPVNYQLYTGDTIFCRPETCAAITEVFQLCLHFFHDAEGFEDWWHALSETMSGMYRKAILVQIQQLDKIIAETEYGLLECRRSTIYLTAQAFSIVEEDVATHNLDADRLVRSSTSEIADTSSWESPRTRSFRHCVGTLRTLDVLLTSRGGSSSNSGTPIKLDNEFTRQENRLKTIVAPWCSPGPDVPCPAREALLARLKSTVDGYKMVQEGPDSSQQESDHREPRMRTMEEAIDDVLIWRIVLMGLLFLTAPDNSVILDSGLWKHVIPLL